VAFPFARSRGHRHAVEILGEYCGTLISDDYGAYEAKRDAVTHASCWAHVRRKFVEAEDVEPERVRRVLDWIRGFYRIEDEIREQKLESEAKLAKRADESQPLVMELFAWLEQELVASALLPTNPFTNAARHALKLKSCLEIFLSDPEVPIDTNHLERALRPIPMGRKAWLFCWTEVGAERVGIIQSLISTCVIHGVDPYRLPRRRAPADRGPSPERGRRSHAADLEGEVRRSGDAFAGVCELDLRLNARTSLADRLLSNVDALAMGPS
jgi:hypothetical protein